MTQLFCFVLMPFGKKLNAAGSEINFDAVYSTLIAPAIEEAGLEPLRADHEATGGLIHKPIYERLVLCDYVVADLTTANANVYYELGVQHAVRPGSTILLFAKDGKQLSFDSGPLRAMPYELQPDGTPANVGVTKAALVKTLMEARQATTAGCLPDSSVF